MWAMRFRTLEAKAFDNKVLTKAGTECWVTWTNEGGGWITSTQRSWHSPPEKAITWDSYPKAVEFAAGWKGHPWYAQVDDYEIIEVFPKMVRVQQGFTLDTGERDGDSKKA